MPFILGKNSLAELDTVHADLASVIKAAIVLTPVDFAVIQGNRTQAEQEALYAQGRAKPGPIVTWTHNSRHIGGHAVDLAAWVDGKIDWNTIENYKLIALAVKLAACRLKVPIVWGGDWVQTKDYPHFELDRIKYP